MEEGRRALVLRCRRPCAAACPAPGDLVLLADAGLVGEPDLYGAGLDAPLAPDRVQARGETFAKASIASLDRALGLRVVPRACRQLAIPCAAVPRADLSGSLGSVAHAPQFAAQRLLGDSHPVLLPLAQAWPTGTGLGCMLGPLGGGPELPRVDVGSERDRGGKPLRSPP